MNKILFLLTLCITGLAGPNTASAKKLSLHPDSDSIAVVIPSVEEMLQEIIVGAGVKADFELKEADVLNLEASVSHRKKFISYNPDYIHWINSITGDKWAAMTLVAHEIGHHVLGHTTHHRGNRLACELEADEFAGYTLYKMGATVDQASEVMIYIARTEDSDTHPGRASRIEAIKTGWNRAATENIAAKTP